MDTKERNTINWINDRKDFQSNGLQYEVSRIVKSALASFADLFDHPKMS